MLLGRQKVCQKGLQQSQKQSTFQDLSEIETVPVPKLKPVQVYVTPQTF